MRPPGRWSYLEQKQSTAILVSLLQSGRQSIHTVESSGSKRANAKERRGSRGVGKNT